MINQPLPKPSIKYVLLALSIVGVLLFVWYFKNILAYILISVVVSLLGGPLMRFLSRVKIKDRHIPNGLSAAITLLLFCFVGGTVLSLVIPLFIAEAEILSNIDLQKAANSLEVIFGKFQDTLSHIIGGKDQGISFSQYIAIHLESFLNYANISNAANVLVSIFGNIFVAVFAILFISFFFLKEPNLFMNSVLVMTPDEHISKTKTIMKSIKKLLTRYFIGLMGECSLIMILITTGLLLAGLDFQKAAVIGFVSGTFNVIPYIGPFISCLFGAAMGVANGIELTEASEIIMSAVVNVLVIGTVFFFNAIVTQPFIHSNSVKAHPLEIFLVILIAGSAAGVPGMILAIPSYTLFRVVAKEFFYHNKVINELTKNI